MVIDLLLNHIIQRTLMHQQIVGLNGQLILDQATIYVFMTQTQQDHMEVIQIPSFKTFNKDQSTGKFIIMDILKLILIMEVKKYYGFLFRQEVVGLIISMDTLMV